MEKQEFLEHCLSAYGVSADYPFDGDLETAVFRHADAELVAFLVNVSYEATETGCAKRHTCKE